MAIFHSTVDQLAYRVTLTLKVTDVAALWAAAAQRGLSAPGARHADVQDVIGPPPGIRQWRSGLQCLLHLWRCPAVLSTILKSIAFRAASSREALDTQHRLGKGVALPDGARTAARARRMA